MLDYTLTINAVSFTNLIERDSYKTQKIPVFTNAITTMDGVDHVALVRHKNVISFSLNPQDAAQTAAACAALLTQPCTVNFFSLQSQSYVTARMILDGQSANYLSRCMYQGLRWNQIEEITLTEL